MIRTLLEVHLKPNSFDQNMQRYSKARTADMFRWLKILRFCRYSKIVKRAKFTPLLQLQPLIRPFHTAFFFPFLQWIAYSILYSSNNIYLSFCKHAECQIVMLSFIGQTYRDFFSSKMSLLRIGCI